MTKALFPIQSRITNTPHKDRCFREATRDAIFLVQRRRINLLSTDIEGLKDNDCETMIVEYRESLPDWVLPLVCDDGCGEYVCINDEFCECCVGREGEDGQLLAIDRWETESVWIDRDEAEMWCRSKSHRFPHGYRVYAVCAEGDLAKLLRAQDVA